MVTAFDANRLRVQRFCRNVRPGKGGGKPRPYSLKFFTSCSAAFLSEM